MRKKRLIREFEDLASFFTKLANDANEKAVGEWNKKNFLLASVEEAREAVYNVVCARIRTILKGEKR